MDSLKRLCLLVIFIGSIVISCTSSKSLYETGNYYESVMRSVEKLRKNPNNKSEREALANAYPQAVNSFMDELENDEQANNAFKFTYRFSFPYIL